MGQYNLLLKIIALTVIGFAVLNLTLRFSEVTSFLQKPLNQGSNSSESNLALDFNYRFNLLLLSGESEAINQATLASFELKDENRLDLLKIPLETASELQKAQTAEELEKELRNVLGLPIDSFVYFEGFSDSLDQNEVISFKNSLSFSNSLKIVDFYQYVRQRIKTSLSFKDLVSVIIKLSNIRDDKIREHSTEELLVAGNLEKSLIDEFAQKYFSVPSVLNEGAKIEVRNATGVSGLAYQVSRIVSNVGGNVINIANDDNISEITTIHAYFDRPKTVEYLSRVLKAKVVREKNEDARADLVVTVGKDFVSEKMP